MVSQEGMNLKRMKVERINKRIKGTSGFSRKQKGILEQRYNNLSKSADEFDRLIKNHLIILDKCHQEWNPSVAFRIGQSGSGIEMKGKKALNISYIPMDSEGEKSIEFLVRARMRTRAHVMMAERRFALRALSKDPNVAEFFRQLSEDGDFLRLFEVHRKASIMASQKAKGEVVSEFIVDKFLLLTAKDKKSCRHAHCAFIDGVNYSLGSVFLFDLDANEDMILPMRLNTNNGIGSTDTLLADTILNARNDEMVFRVLCMIANEDQSDKPEVSDRLKELMEETLKRASKKHE